MLQFAGQQWGDCVSKASFITLFLTLLPLCFFLRRIFASPPQTRRNLPPSPWRLPLLGNFHQLGSSPHRSLHSLSRRHGPLMQLRFGGVPVVVASTADAAREIMKTHDLVFSDRFHATIPHRLLYDSKDVSMAPYGEYWRQMRSITVLHLLSNRRVGNFRTVRHQETALLIQSIRNSAAAAQAIDLTEMLVSVTNDVVCRAALGRKCIRGGLRETLNEFVRLLGVFNVADFLPWLSWMNRLTGLDDQVERIFKDFDCFLDAVVEEHAVGMNKGGGEEDEDFVDVLLKLQKENTTGFPIDRDTIKALILDPFAAGTDTTATVLEWAMTELLRHPRVMKKLQEEARGIPATHRGILTEEELQGMEFLRAVMKETLRLHPPIPLLVPRRSTREVKLRGYDVSAGTIAIVNAWAVGRDPATWGAEAERFCPERFMGRSVDYRGQDLELIPFGAGRRGCPGIAFAMATNELVLANLVREFDWALPGGKATEEVDMAEGSGLSIRRKNPLLVIATPHVGHPGQ